MKSLGVAYAWHYNKKFQHLGPVFQDRFRSEPVNDNAYFFTLLRYIHQNPLKAGLVENVSDYHGVVGVNTMAWNISAAQSL